MAEQKQPGAPENDPVVAQLKQLNKNVANLYQLVQLLAQKYDRGIPIGDPPERLPIRK